MSDNEVERRLVAVVAEREPGRQLELLDMMELAGILGIVPTLKSQVGRKPAEPTFRCGICGEEKKMKQLASTGALRGHQCQACYFAKVDGGW